MRWSRLICLSVGLMGLLGVSADAPREATDLLRWANAAARQGQFEQATLLYTQASERTTDPGLVAFNRGLAAIARGDELAAELDFRRCLEDDQAPKDRQARALYNWAVCVLVRGRTSADFRIAIACLNQALTLQENDEPFQADLRHNLELAKWLWMQARLTEATPPKPSDVPNDAPRPRPPEASRNSSNDSPGMSDGDASPSRPDPTENGKLPSGANGTPQPTDQQRPGAGAKPVLLDPARSEPLTPAQARDYLQSALQRIANDRRTTARLVAGPDHPHVRDW